MTVLKIETNLPNMDEDLILTRKYKQAEIVPAYSCIGGNMNYRTREESYPNLFGVLKELSKNSTWFLWSLIERRNTETNIAVFKAADPKESRKVTTAYKELTKLDIIKRVKRQHYLINPKVMLPIKGNYMAVRTHWGEI